MKVDVVDTFSWFVHERHTIWELRQRGEPAPWTQDPVLATRRFCNVFRWLDRGTQAVINKVLCQFPNDHLRTIAPIVVAYRLTNTLHILDSIVDQVDGMSDVPSFFLGDGFIEMLRCQSGGIYSPAYVLPAASGDAKKIDTTAKVVKEVTAKLLTQCDLQSPFDVKRTLLSCHGIGEFLSTQIMADLAYDAAVQWDETETDACIGLGPGAQRGLAAIASDTVTAASAQYIFHTLLLVLRPITADVKAFGIPLSAMDLQNCLCEFSKWLRANDTSSKHTMRRAPEEWSAPLQITPPPSLHNERRPQ